MNPFGDNPIRRNTNPFGDSLQGNTAQPNLAQAQTRAFEDEINQDLTGNVAEQALVGLGRGFQTVGEGAKGLALDAGNALGLVDDSTVNEFDASTRAGRQEFSQTPLGQTTVAKVGEFAGEVLPTLPAGAGVLAGGAKVATKLGAGARLAQTAGLSSLGALEGALVSDTGNQAGGAALGAVAAPVVAKGVKSIGSGVGALVNRSQPNKALQLINKDLASDGIEPSQLRAKLTELGDDAVLADVGGVNTQRLTDVAFQRGGDAVDSTQKLLDSRQSASIDRVEKSIKGKVGDFDNFIAQQDSIIDNMKSQAAPLYDQAHQVEIPIDKNLQDVLMVGGELKPAIKKAWKKAQELASNEGVQLSQIGDDLISTRELDYIKRGLDDVIERNTSDFGKVNTTGRAITTLKNNLLEVVDSQNPAFAEARKVYSDGATLKRALDDGLTFFRSDAGSLGKKLEQMTDSERLMFQQGAAKGLRDKLAKAPEGANQFKRALGNKFGREQIEAVIGSDNYRTFFNDLNAENVFSNTRAKFQGSPTQPRQQKNAEAFADGVGAISDVATGNKPGLVRRVLDFAANRRVGNNEKANEIVKAMFAEGMDQQNVIDALISLERRVPIDQKDSFRTAIGLVTGNSAANIVE